MTLRLDRKIALVTGGGSGIGRATCSKLAEEGATVIVSDVNETGGLETVSDVEAAGGKATFVRHDVTREDAWIDILAGIERDHGRLDILVNNAGLYKRGSLDEMSLEQFRQLSAVNVDGVFLGLKYGGGLMKKAGAGSIVNLSSGAGIVGSPGAVGYCATKGAVRLMTKAAALELARASKNIRVNSVHPGFVQTPMGEQVIHEIGGDFDRRREQLTRAIPLREWADPADIANGIAFLASDESRYMTGSELVIDGGVTAQ